MQRLSAPTAGPSSRCTAAAAATRGRRTLTVTRASATPMVQLTVQTKEGETINFEVESGDQLRAVLMANKVDLYTTWGKVWSCGGAGQCGTCIVQIKGGAELLSERTAVEQKKLSGKPESWRLACQTLVGDGETSGAVTIGTKP